MRYNQSHPLLHPEYGFLYLIKISYLQYGCCFGLPLLTIKYTDIEKANQSLEADHIKIYQTKGEELRLKEKSLI